MLPLKLVRSLVLGDAINNHLLLTPNHQTRDSENPKKSNTKLQTKIPLLFFIPTKELVTDAYKLATLARDIGMDFCPNSSLSHIIFSWPSSSSSSSSGISSWSSTSLPNDAVLLPFPSLIVSSVSHLRSFVSLSKGFFKLVFLKSNLDLDCGIDYQSSNWDCCSVSLILRLTNCRISSMDCFCKALAGQGWTLFRTKYNPCADSSDRPVWGSNAVYLFRKMESARVLARQHSSGSGAGSLGEGRVRELRLPPLDFRNAPLRILQYILLMTDDIFYLA